jgi:hypothetical protein
MYVNGEVTLTGSNAIDGAVVTPNDGTDLAKIPTKGVYVGVSGDVKVTLSSGAVLTFTGLSSGAIHPIAAKRIWATGTTALNILAVY